MEDMAKQTSYRGCLLGLAVGDAMGYTVDDRSLEQIRTDYGPEGLLGYDLVNGYADVSSYTQLAAFTANGLLLGEALKASDTLAAEGIRVRVINMATIKPLDRELVWKAAAETGAIVTAEEHNIIGGLGSAVAEAVAEKCPVPVLRVGVQDTFGKSGPALDLLPLFGLSADAIIEKVREALELKK